jgi:hypothetical protein
MEGKMGARRYWWVEDLIDSDAKAMGVYIALFYLLVEKTYNFESKPSGSSIMHEPRAMELHALFFASKGVEARLSFEAATTFIDRLFEHEDALDRDKRRQILCEIESEFYSKFLSAFKKYVRLDQIPKELREKIRDILLDIRSKLYGGETITPAGAFIIGRSELFSGIRTYHGLVVDDTEKLLSCLRNSGLAKIDTYRGYDYYVFPSPSLSDEIIELIVKPPEIAAIDRLIPPPPRPERFEVKPSREVLEGIVASVLEDLGFKAFTNVRKEPRRGSPIEVDVWAQRIVANTRFSVYVSCRNWDKAIDRSVIDEETGRVLNLRELPQLKVIIAKELTSPAREAAEADGFLVIELGRKAEADTAREIYELVYKALSELFFSIAPPKLREIASRIADVRERLREIEGELTSLLTR